MARPPSSSLTSAQKRVLEAVLRRDRLRLPNFVSDLVADLALKAESSLGPTLQRMARLGVILLQGGGVKGRQRLVVPTDKGRVLCGLSPTESADGRAFPTLQSTSAFSRLLPLLGSITAGPLEEVISSPDCETVEVGALLNHRPGDFLLRIKGDSMVGDGILDGDLVLLRPKIEVKQGEIAAVIARGTGADCDATLKRVFKRALKRASGSGSSGSSGNTGVRDMLRGADGEESLEQWEEREGEEGEIVLRASNPAYADMVLPAASVRIAGVFRGLVRPSVAGWPVAGGGWRGGVQ
jgi:repressor LexA